MSRSTNLETLDVTSVDLHFFAVYIVVRAALKRFIEHALHQQQDLSAVFSAGHTMHVNTNIARGGFTGHRAF